MRALHRLADDLEQAIAARRDADADGSRVAARLRLKDVETAAAKLIAAAREASRGEE